MDGYISVITEAEWNQSDSRHIWVITFSIHGSVTALTNVMWASCYPEGRVVLRTAGKIALTLRGIVAQI